MWRKIFTKSVMEMHSLPKNIFSWEPALWLANSQEGAGAGQKKPLTFSTEHLRKLGFDRTVNG